LSNLRLFSAGTDHSGFTGSQAYTLTIDPGAATHFAITGPSSITAGTPFNLTVTALDASATWPPAASAR
jgi:hypothetical protein